MIHGSGKVHEEEQREASFLAKATVREANAGGLNELRRRSLVSVAAHEISIDEIGPHPGSFIARAFRRR